eukprot:CCRYP_017012-RA/>CCRYP_017012-RA protein AED:0.25 eAED:0.22 QI:0/0/0/1/0/0/2/0/135
MKEKLNEFVHDDARLLVILTEENALLRFVHYCFDPDNKDDPIALVAYVYEIQLQSIQQKSGRGKCLMIIVELLALKCCMEKVMLTVFKVNTKALGFYLHKIKYEVDECSPSNFLGEENENCDYEILSKSLVFQSK